jgi:pyruvate kinase
MEAMQVRPARGVFADRDRVVVMASMSFGPPGATNMVRIAFVSQ